MDDLFCIIVNPTLPVIYWTYKLWLWTWVTQCQVGDVSLSRIHALQFSNEVFKRWPFLGVILPALHHYCIPEMYTASHRFQTVWTIWYRTKSLSLKIEKGSRILISHILSEARSGLNSVSPLSMASAISLSLISAYGLSPIDHRNEN